MLVFVCNVLVIHSLWEIILASFHCCFDLESRVSGMVAEESKNRVIACLYLLVEGYVVGVGDRINSALVYVYMLY